MPEVQDYTSGEILEMIKKGFKGFEQIKVPIIGSLFKNTLLNVFKKCAPKKIDVRDAAGLIESSDVCAVGERVCNALHQDAEPGDSVFLDELAIGMIEAGKARQVTKQVAIETISVKKPHPIIITNVSGKYAEICRSIPKKCIYWNAEKRGLKCIAKNKKGRNHHEVP